MKSRLCAAFRRPHELDLEAAAVGGLAVAADQQGRLHAPIRAYRRPNKTAAKEATLPWYWSDPTVVLMRPLAGIGSPPGGRQSRSTESAESVDRSDAIGPPKSPGRSTEISKSVDRDTPSRWTENAKGVG